MIEQKTVIDLHDIVKRFYIGQPNELEILHGISLQVKEGEFVSIVGESGSGKSTLMNIIGALDRPTSGEYMALISARQRIKGFPKSEISRLALYFRLTI